MTALAEPRRRLTDYLGLWPLAPAFLVFVGALRRPARLFLRHQLLVGPGAHHAPGLHPQELRRDLDRVWRHARQHAAASRSRSRSRRRCSPSASPMSSAFAPGRFGNALLFLTLITLFGGYLVKIYAWKSILGRDGILNLALIDLGLIDEPLDALHLQRQRHRHHAHLLPAALRRAADLRQHARDPRRDARSGARSRRRRRGRRCATSSCRNASAASSSPSCSPS